MRVKLLIAVVAILVVACASMASAVYIHVHRPVGSLGELGVYCSNGADPTVVGMEEKYLIVSCGK
jgi:hypothetical protein